MLAMKTKQFIETEETSPTRQELRQLFSRELMLRQLEIDRAVAVNLTSSPNRSSICS